MLDTITNEWKFYNDFFGDDVAQKKDIFGPIFGTTINVFLESVDSFLSTCYDAIGILLMLRVTAKSRNLMSKTRQMNIGGLDEYFRLLRKKCLERFNFILALNSESLDKAEIIELCEEVKNKLSSPHYITRRYAEFSAAINALNADLGNDKNVEGGATQLREKMEELLNRMAAQLDGNKNKHIFYINNHDLILTILGTREVFSSDRERFTSLLEQQIAAFVGLQLSTHYQSMITFINTAKENMEKGYCIIS